MIFLYQYKSALVNAKNANKFKRFCFTKECVVDPILSPPKECYAVSVQFEFVALDGYEADIIQAVEEAVYECLSLVHDARQVYFH